MTTENDCGCEGEIVNNPCPTPIPSTLNKPSEWCDPRLLDLLYKDKVRLLGTDSCGGMCMVYLGGCGYLVMTEEGVVSASKSPCIKYDELVSYFMTETGKLVEVNPGEYLRQSPSFEYVVVQEADGCLKRVRGMNNGQIQALLYDGNRHYYGNPYAGGIKVLCTEVADESNLALMGVSCPADCALPTDLLDIKRFVPSKAGIMIVDPAECAVQIIGCDDVSAEKADAIFGCKDGVFGMYATVALASNITMWYTAVDDRATVPTSAAIGIWVEGLFPAALQQEGDMANILYGQEQAYTIGFISPVSAADVISGGPGTEIGTKTFYEYRVVEWRYKVVAGAWVYQGGTETGTFNNSVDNA